MEKCDLFDTFLEKTRARLKERTARAVLTSENDRFHMGRIGVIPSWIRDKCSDSLLES